MINAQYEVMGDLKARDWVAVLAMQGILAGGKSGHDTGNQTLVNEVARQAYAIADAMLDHSRQDAKER